MANNWRKLEDHVRGIASLRWNVACKPEHIMGVDFDAVARVSADEIVLIEITEERTLLKVREDLAKLIPVRMTLANQGMICRTFIVMADEPTSSMIEAGRAAHVLVCSSQEFEKIFFDFNSYCSLRRKLPFGSAVDSKTGENDVRRFVSVRYFDPHSHDYLSVDDVANKLLKGDRIALTGDFGTGKSRCVSEVFQKLVGRVKEAGAFPIAINLRDHWSSSNALEVLAGHLGNVGLSSSIDNLVRLLNSGSLILLLDGFDEIGAQSHDIRVEDRIALRRHAVRGIRDLVQRSKAGILVTGRSHFFDSDEEMLQSLGLRAERPETCVLHVPEFFTTAEGEQYFKELGIDAPVPHWLPRKPLVFQVLVELDHAVIRRILEQEHGQFEFWGTFLTAVCSRESKGVADSISPITIRHILLELASVSRHSSAFLGRLTPSDITDAYAAVVGSSPDQNGQQLLARMCTLGRIEPESPDRQFIDANAVDVLRAEALMRDIVSMAARDTLKQWKQSLRTLGAIFAACSINLMDLENLCFAYLKKYGTTANTKRLGEIVSALSLFSDEPLNFQGLQLIDAEMPFLHVSSRTIHNLHLKRAVINSLWLQNTPVKESDGLIIEDSFFSRVEGVSDQVGLPNWVKNCEVVAFERLSNSARIKDSGLSGQHKLFLSIIHKIFFQPGGGREEGSLLKGGYGQKYSPKLVDSILKLLMSEKVVSRTKGDDGWVYHPVRRYTERMNKIKAELTLSEDPLWAAISVL